MNAHGRKKAATEKRLVKLGVVANSAMEAARAETERLRTRAAGLDILLTEARGHIASFGRAAQVKQAEHATLLEERLALQGALGLVHDRLTQAQADISTLTSNLHEGAFAYGELHRKVAKMEVEDKDAAKLRRRLQERTQELEDAKACIRELQDKARERAQTDGLAAHLRSAFVHGAFNR